VDDGAALVVNAAGEGRRLASGAGPGVFVVKGGAPERVTAGAPLVYAGLEIVKLADDTHFWDLGRRCGRGLARTIAIDGSRTPPYPADVYAGGEAGSNCR
jgi:hypothetical protein